jgi:hypothetical protein
VDTGLFICSTRIEAKHSIGDAPLHEKLSHEFGGTEIERFSNCYSFRSFMVPLKPNAGKEYLSTFHCRFCARVRLIDRCALEASTRATMTIMWWSQAIELGEVGVTATFKRHADDSPRYQAGRGAGNRIRRETGEACIKHFTDNCPIYVAARPSSLDGEEIGR